MTLMTSTRQKKEAYADDPDDFLDRWVTVNIEIDEDAKVHWAKTVGKPRYHQFTISGEP